MNIMLAQLFNKTDLKKQQKKHFAAKIQGYPQSSGTQVVESCSNFISLNDLADDAN